MKKKKTKNVANDGFIKMIATVAMVLVCPKKHQYCIAWKKDHRHRIATKI